MTNEKKELTRTIVDFIENIYVYFNYLNNYLIDYQNILFLKKKSVLFEVKKSHFDCISS